jgi:hypothetical protein
MADHSEIAESLRPLSRRRFLLGAAAGTAMTVAACSMSKATPLPPSIKHLSTSEYRMFTRLTRVFLPTAAFQMTPLEEVPILENIDAFMGSFDEGLRSDLGIAFALFGYGSYVLGFHFASFADLDDQSAESYCRRWQSGNTIQRGVFAALRQIVYISYWREEATWAPIAYGGPMTARLGIERYGNAPPPED